MNGAAALAAALVACSALGCGVFGSYGPPQDHSRFEGAVLMPDRTVLFSFSYLVYRPAAGITAFPDGGIPRYLKDEAVLATYHIPSGKVRILRRERNRRWTDGQGRFGIQRAKGTMALVTQGGQLRRDLSENVYENWLIDIATGSAQPVEWKSALAERGRTMTELYLVDGSGTLLFVTAPLGAATRAAAREDAWLWVRTAGGEFVRVAETSHYERTAGEEIVYWIPQTRRFMAFNVSTRATKDLPGYRVPPQEEIDEGVIVETGGRRLLFGRRQRGVWEYQPLPLETDRLKERRRWPARRGFVYSCRQRSNQTDTKGTVA